MYERQTALIISLFLIAVCFLQFLVYCHQSQLLSSSTEVEQRFIATDLTAAEDALKTSVPVEAGSVALLVLAAIWRWQGSAAYEEPRGHGSRQHLYWLAVANRRMYAQQNGYPLYVLSHHLEAGRWPTWDKLLAARAVLQHSKAEWLWMTDADAFVMNQQLPVSDIIASAVQHSLHVRGSIPDVIAAHDCIIPINSGSLIFHNTPWTHQHLADLWHADDNCNGYTDNGAFLELWKQQEVQQHYWQVPQRQLNAYPHTSAATGPACPGGIYQEGDLLLHFPGDYKAALPAFLRRNRLPHTSLTAADAPAPLHQWLRHSRLLQTVSTAAATAAAPAQPPALDSPVRDSKAATEQGHSRKHQPVDAAATLGTGAVEDGQAGKSDRHDVPCFAVYDNHVRGSTDAAGRQAGQQHAELVEVNMVSTRHQGITSTTKATSITLSIQRQHAQDGQTQPQSHAGAPQGASALAPKHISNPGWPIAVPAGGWVKGKQGTHPQPDIPVTDIDHQYQ